ncbi:MAG: hypothetical protein EKK29_12500 [Hyphomicrobiales bacterium]|nr:MAG: hypothetical protein EKK29_12500 [Hyphomicrobiales bacterium]
MESCLVWSVVALLSCGLWAMILTDGSVRRAVHLSLARRIGGVFSPEIIVVGDSLAASCRWTRLAGRPFGVLNLAAGGATLKEIAGQIYSARGIEASFLLINGGLNDLLFDAAQTDRLEEDFVALTRRIDNGVTVAVTLMPFVDDVAKAQRIQAANTALSCLCRQRGYLTVDLNPSISANGARRPDMTTDGLHFTRAAEAIWVGAIQSAISERR